MADKHHAEEHHGPTFKTYLVIFGALSVLTLVSFIANAAVRNHKLEAGTSFIIILSVAVVKTILVALYFMHLVVDWGRLYYFIIPAIVLAALAVIVLMPDMVFGWRHLWLGGS